MSRQVLYRGPSFDVLHEKYAKRGRLDEKAPVQASAQIHIYAPVERVWKLLIDLPAWPAIDPSVRDVQIDAGVNVDALFKFKLNDFPIRAKFAVIDPCRELHWTGVSLWLKAIDLHRLEPAHDGGAQLFIAESFAGLLATLFISSERLKMQHEKWLAAFKRAAESASR